MVKLLEDSQQQFRHELSRFTKIFIYLVAVLILLVAMFCMLAIFRISSFAFQTYDSYQNIPFNKVGVLLGTSSNVGPGQDNHYFTYRIMAATELYNAGRIEYILVSGDNQHDSYNEPRMMYRALVKNGIPPERITMDFAGLNTLNSVVRAARVFMLPNMTIISQGFQNERALFIANHFGIRAIAYNATDPDTGWNSLKISLREIAARIKCILDVYFLDTQPKFLGEPIRIGDIVMPKLPSNKVRRPSSKPKLPGLSAAGLKAAGLPVPKLELARRPLTSYRPELTEEQSAVPQSKAEHQERTVLQVKVQEPPQEASIPVAAEPQVTKPAVVAQSPAPAKPTAPEQAARLTERPAEPKPPAKAPTASSKAAPQLKAEVLSTPEPEEQEEHPAVPLTQEQLDNLKQQEDILRAEQAQALAAAAEAAAESLNTGTSSTYIDPNISESNEMVEQSAQQSPTEE